MKITNRKARHDYFIVSEYEAGIVLEGSEVKAIRSGKANINDAFCKITKQELFIHNMHIAHYDFGNQFNHDERRVRKLLLHRSELNKLSKEVKLMGYTIIPLAIYFKRGYAKVLIGLAKGKKNYDKRQTLKEKDINLNIKKQLKYK